MSKEVDGSLYDNYGWDPWANRTMFEVRWVHFTGACQKPVSCRTAPPTADPLCGW